MIPAFSSGIHSWIYRCSFVLFLWVVSIMKLYSSSEETTERMLKPSVKLSSKKCWHCVWIHIDCILGAETKNSFAAVKGKCRGAFFGKSDILCKTTGSFDAENNGGVEIIIRGVYYFLNWPKRKRVQRKIFERNSQNILIKRKHVYSLFMLCA